MKRIIALLLLFALCFSLPGVFSSCVSSRALPSGCVRDGTPQEMLYDNDTPFDYAPEYTTAHRPKGWDFFEMHAILNACLKDPELNSYAALCRHIGTRIIRRSTDAEGREVFYTVVTPENNRLFYLFLTPDETLPGDLRLSPDSGYADVRNDPQVLRDAGILEKDLPAAILGDALPPEAVPENWSYDKAVHATELNCLDFAELCTKASLPDFGKMRHDARQNGDPLTATVRCMKDVSFEEEREWATTLYVYDLLVHESGKASLSVSVLYFDSASWCFLPFEDECFTAAVTGDDAAALLALFEEKDFRSIPTQHPEEEMGLDGSTTYIYDGSHLIAMWEPTPQYAIYDLRQAFETLAAKYAPQN